MYNDLMEHFPAILALLGIFAGSFWYLLWHLINRLEKKLDEFGTRLVNVVQAAVTKTECDARHTELLTVITSLLNCQNCGRSKKRA